ncbi:hypothetical protein AMS68_006612 [Peltaster fructicola]|uniref:Uncharacterized protein n=1 Tax=Peltaster fructicola TaxID=286661 RepID=A0A6H0Y2E9_9PEZI|nr:hypothetical protein AMS68_006612 [Peltaster fructicola]
MPLSNKQMEYLAIAWACFETEPKIDYEKFRELANLKTANSARELMRVTKLKLKSEYGPTAGGAQARSSKTASDTPAKQTPTNKKTTAAKKSTGRKRTAAEATAKTEPDDDDQFEFTVPGDDPSSIKKPRPASMEEVPEDSFMDEPSLFTSMPGVSGYFSKQVAEVQQVIKDRQS